MIDVYAPVGLISDKHKLAQELAQTIMRWEKIPVIPFFTDNTAAFVHELPRDAFATAGGSSDHVRVQVITNAGALDREQQLGVVTDITALVAAAAGDPSLAERFPEPHSFSSRVCHALTHPCHASWSGPSMSEEGAPAEGIRGDSP